MDDFKNEYDDSTNVIVELNKNVEDTLYDEDNSDIIVFFKENININDTFKIKSIENNNIYGEKIIINN